MGKALKVGDTVLYAESKLVGTIVDFHLGFHPVVRLHGKEQFGWSSDNLQKTSRSRKSKQMFWIFGDGEVRKLK